MGLSNPGSDRETFSRYLKRTQTSEGGSQAANEDAVWTNVAEEETKRPNIVDAVPRVYGTPNLSVVAANVMPSITRVDTMGTMAAEEGSEQVFEGEVVVCLSLLVYAPSLEPN
ncbi:hypothetical protein MYCTH_2123970 [Thermothelomyces thermophilus ATCC 42464]|uniref:Uncharacterized protein n=1 Tax=Thermothelomyces thermophilus (strain ATCC 42464 / BCRC 31852 / DSM 1799) TaxID=573729 RepID=G2Q205_THET4|nr:uncharacterized protein MYCTH_2123970 [Thermothelomyces thermophilus ATCC 42464]AEO55038.1 hypothetical protein MYCTH_2123970 [Thermothelomyces thermophilus ATCC 42464]